MTQQKDNEELATEMDYASNDQERDLTAASVASQEAETAAASSLVQAEVDRIEGIEGKTIAIKKEATEEDLPDFDDATDAPMPQKDNEETDSVDQNQGQALTAKDEASDLKGAIDFLNVSPKSSDNSARNGDGLGDPAAANASTLPSPPPPPTPQAKPPCRSPGEWTDLTDDKTLCSTCHIYGKNRPSDYLCAKCQTFGLCNRCNGKGVCLACRTNHPGYIEAADPRWAHDHKTLGWCHTHRKKRGIIYMDEVGGSYRCKPEYQCQCSTEPSKGKSKDKGKKGGKGKKSDCKPGNPPGKDSTPPYHPES